MNILVNCSNLASAGGLAVAINFLTAVGRTRRGHRYFVWAPIGVGYESIVADDVVLLPVRKVPALVRIATQRRTVRHLIRAHAIDVVFTVGNFAVPTDLPQGLVFMWPYAIYPEGEIWGTMRLSERLSRRVRLWVFRRRLRYASLLFPQTLTSALRLRRYYDIDGKAIEIVPTASAALSTEDVSVLERLRERVGEGPVVVLCVTRYYPHKNLEILPTVLQHLRASGRDVRIVLTLDPAQDPAVPRLLRSFAEADLESALINLGQLPLEAVGPLYERADVMLLPTLLESYSATYVDAMQSGVPICTSDRDFAREVCGEAAVYFDPLNVADIVRALESLLDDSELRTRIVAAGRARVSEGKDWPQIAAAYITGLERLVRPS